MPLWRERLRPPSFRGAGFHVASDGRAGGRRLAPREFPKRDSPLVEDMGRAMRRWTISGYVIGDFYQAERDRLIDALEQEGPGLLIHPAMGEALVHAGPYSVTETVDKGGMAIFEMAFLESGQAMGERSTEDTSGSVADRSYDAQVAAIGSMDAFQDPSVKAGPR